VQQVNEIVAETLHELIDPLVYAEAVALFDEHHAAGRDVVLVSSSGEEVVGPIGDMLGVDHVVATRMEVQDGRYTGEIAFYAYGEHKATAVHALAEEHGYDLAACYAYSDSATDLPMLEAVGHPHAVNPDKGLRRVAVERGWPVDDFRRRCTRASARACPPARPARGLRRGGGGGRGGRRRVVVVRPQRTSLRVLPSGRRQAYNGRADPASGRTTSPPTAVRARRPGTHVRPAPQGTSTGPPR
jgi:phosphoserine phosphatase